jgi:hypothetical protein
VKAGRAALTTVALVLLALAVNAPVATATFHFVSVREVYPGSAAAPNAEYVELQMWASDQHFVAGHLVRTYDAAGALTGTDPFPTDVPRGANQSTLVLATPEAEAALGFAADAPMTPSGRLDPSGGAVCWEQIDCVAWGGFSGSLPNPTGTPAVGVPDGMALRRTIAPGCPTLLEALDDHDDSAIDFAPVFPAPRPNLIAPSERPCGGSSTGGNAGTTGPTEQGHGAPQTTLRGKPPKRSRDRTPTFRFGASEPGARYECKLDRRPFRACKSPFTAKPISPGPHIFKVRARGHDGDADRSPASYGFRVLVKRP